MIYASMSITIHNLLHSCTNIITIYSYNNFSIITAINCNIQWFIYGLYRYAIIYFLLFDLYTLTCPIMLFHNCHNNIFPFNDLIQFCNCRLLYADSIVLCLLDTWIITMLIYVIWDNADVCNFLLYYELCTIT